MIEAFAKILSYKLRERIVARRIRLSDDTVANALEEIVDAIPETLAELKHRGLIEAPALNPGALDVRDFYCRAEAIGKEVIIEPAPPRAAILGG